MTDENGNRTQYILDGNGNIVETIDALGTSAKFTTAAGVGHAD